MSVVIIAMCLGCLSMPTWRHPARCRHAVAAEVYAEAHEDPTALSVLFMLLPAVWTFCPWALACS